MALVLNVIKSEFSFLNQEFDTLRSELKEKHDLLREDNRKLSLMFLKIMFDNHT